MDGPHTSNPRTEHGAARGGVQDLHLIRDRQPQHTARTLGRRPAGFGTLPLQQPTPKRPSIERLERRPGPSPSLDSTEGPNHTARERCAHPATCGPIPPAPWASMNPAFGNPHRELITHNVPGVAELSAWRDSCTSTRRDRTEVRSEGAHAPGAGKSAVMRASSPGFVEAPRSQHTWPNMDATSPS
jgi:hypothetical protein